MIGGGGGGGGAGGGKLSSSLHIIQGSHHPSKH